MATPEFYCDVFDRLEREKVRYVVVGGIAVCLRGYVRPVADLDIVVDGSPGEAQRALTTLMAGGFVPTLPLPLSALSVLRMFDGMRREVDLFVRYYISFEQLVSDAEMLEVGNSRARVASFEHVIRVKRVTRRPHDLEDIEALLSRVEGGRGEKTGQQGEDG